MNKERSSDLSEKEENVFSFSTENSTGFSAELIISNKQLEERISKATLDLKIESVFNLQPSLVQAMRNAFRRKNTIMYCVSTKEISIDISEAIGNVYLPLITNEEIQSKLQKMKPKERNTISTLHIGAIKILLKAQFRNGINTPVKMALLDNRINNREEALLGAAKGNLAYGKFMFTAYPKFGVNIFTKNLNQVLSLIHEFSYKDFMNKGDKIMSVTYLVGYALSNSHHSIDYQSSKTIELEDVFQEIGNVNQSSFCTLENDDCEWAIDIAKNKEPLGKPKRTLVKNNLLSVGSSSSSKNSSSELAMLVENVNHLKDAIQKITD
ncbi:movement protein [Lamium leaf distortion virus]|uniref:Movement protein n=1 Tax=Lamium leaf distortion virus TaxID=515320 RepID=B2CXY1_9VIRU|nr:movement protein [Lamium leaf distortion virus]ACB69763.1 movement protein [Lamium leaf distortion virus]